MRINCHCHIFSIDCVPSEFRERFFLDLRNPTHRFAHWLLRRFLPSESHLTGWLNLADMSIAGIARKLIEEMDEAGIDLCTPLMMDMAYCEAFGGATKRFEEQIEETAQAVREINAACGRTRMLPFIAADPRRPGIVDTVEKALEEGPFVGVKIYPGMGYLPSDRRLYPIYERCEAGGLPVTTHCENGGIPGLGDYYRLAAPEHWESVLGDFPNLKLNLAHYDRLRLAGRRSRWQRKIEEMLLAHPNVYTDVSFDTEMWYIPRPYFKNLKRMLATPGIREKVLYGTDWYMGRFLWTEASYLKWYQEYAGRIFWCRVRFSNEEIQRLTEENPKRFLGIPGDAQA